MVTENIAANFAIIFFVYPVFVKNLPFQSNNEKLNVNKNIFRYQFKLCNIY